MKSKIAFCIDMGGTFLKGAIVNENHELLTPIYQVPAHSNQPFKDYEKGLEEMFSLLEKEREKNHLSLSFIAFSCPGPFDYASGVSYMKHKYQAIYQISLRAYIQERFNYTCPIYFENDVISFLLGESSSLKHKEEKNICAITLGTGLGYVLEKRGEIERNPLGSPLEVLYNRPYLDGIMEDYFSGRGLVSFYEKISSKRVASAYEVYVLATQKDQDALTALAVFGRELGKALSPFFLENKVTDLFLGGQVSASSPFFLKYLKEELPNTNIHVTEDGTKGAIIGLAEKFFN